jgi:ComF family protein
MEKFIRLFISPWIVPTCKGCDNFLTEAEFPLCWRCERQLHKTNHFNLQYNPLYNELSWRLPLFSVQSLTYFKQQSVEQKLLHQLKYKKSREIGIWMGKQLATLQKKSRHLYDVDLLLPIPMSLISQRKRGYNQAEQIALGINQLLHIPIAFPLKKKHQSSNTTKKNRKTRMNTNQNPFISSFKLESYNHVLIVDDVITTGSTVSQFIQRLEIDSNIKISLVTFSHTL